MAKTEIGNLSIRLSASADAFEKVLDGAQKRLTSFAAKAASPISFASKISGLASGALLGPLGVATAAVGTIADALSPSTAHLLNPAKYLDAMKETQTRIVEIAREAKRLDVEPKFLRALRLAAGPDAEAAEKGITRLLRAVGEARRGGELSELAGERGAMGKFAKWGLNPNEWKTTEEAVLAVSKRYSELGDRTQQAAMGFDLLGKGASGFHGILSDGGAKIEGYIKQLGKLGLYNPRQVALALANKELEKEFALEKESADVMEFGKYGARFAELAETRRKSGILSGRYWGAVGSTLSLSYDKFLESTFGIPGSFELTGRQQEMLAKVEATQAKEFADAATEPQRKLREAILETEDAWYRQMRAINMTTEQAKIADLVEQGATPEMLDRLKDAADMIEAKRIGKSMEDLNKSLDEQLHLLTLTSAEAKVYAATLGKLGDADAKNMAARVKAVENAELVKKLGEDTKTPFEKYQDEVARIDEAFGRGEFRSAKEREIAGRAILRAGKGFMADDWKLAPTALAGSNEAASLINRDIMQQKNAQRDPVQRIVEGQAKAQAELAALRRQAEAVARIVEQNGIGILTGTGGQ